MKSHWLSILNWLYHYPEVEVTYDPPNVAHARWTSFWASPEARQHMVNLIRILDGSIPGEASHVDNVTAPAIEHLPGGTPRLTTQTFKALIARGWVCPVKMRPPGGGLSGMYWWQLSEAGKTILMQELYGQSEFEPDAPQQGRLGNEHEEDYA